MSRPIILEVRGSNNRTMPESKIPKLIRFFLFDFAKKLPIRRADNNIPAAAGANKIIDRSSAGTSRIVLAYPGISVAIIKIIICENIRRKNASPTSRNLIRIEELSFNSSPIDFLRLPARTLSETCLIFEFGIKKANIAASKNIKERRMNTLERPIVFIAGPAKTYPINIDPKSPIPNMEFAGTSFSFGTSDGIRGDSAGT